MSIDAIPLWSFFLGLILLVSASLEGGFRLGRFAHKRSEDEKESPVSVMSGAILGLGAFVLAFTFGIVANRFDQRKELVRDEANAIRTAWLQSDFLPEPHRDEAKTIMRSYLDERLDLAQSRLEPDRLARFHAAVERDQAQLWEMAVSHAHTDLNSDIGALYFASLNDVFTSHAERVSVGLESRIPIAVWIVLLLVTALGMFSVGYQTGIADSKRSMAQPVLAIAFALIITLTADLDRPANGYMRVSQQPLINLQSWMSRRTGSAGSRGDSPAGRPGSKSVAPAPTISGA